MLEKSWLIPLTFVLLAAAAVPIYRWVDEAGNVHYTDQPPPAGLEGEALELLPPPRADDVTAAQQRLQRMSAELQASRDQRAAAQEQQRQQREVAEAERALRLEQCVTAQQNLHVLQLRQPVYRIDERGERVFVSDAERAAEIARMQTEIDAYCD